MSKRGEKSLRQLNNSKLCQDEGMEECAEIPKIVVDRAVPGSNIPKVSVDKTASSMNNAKKTINYKNYVVVPEWDAGVDDSKEEAVTSEDIKGTAKKLACIIKDHNHSVGSNSSEEFDILRYLKYQEWKYKLFAAKRSEGVRNGKLDSNKSISDEEILQEMISAYGEMDLESPQFKKLFETYKESYMEQVEECRAKENTVLQCEESIEIHPSYVQDEIASRFTPSEIAMFDNMNDSSVFCLPRPTQNLGPKTVKKCKAIQLKSGLELKKVYVNLSQFDPKYYNFPRWTNVDQERRMEAGLCRSLNKLIHEFPCGITPDLFWERFYNKFNYCIDYQNYGFRSVNEIITSLTDVFHIVKQEDEKRMIIFPASFRCQIASMSDIRTRLRHFILNALYIHEGFLEVEKIPETILNLTGITFNCLDWGFNTIKEFVESYIQLDSDYVTMQSITTEDKISVIVDYYLVINAPCYTDTFNSFKIQCEKKTDRFHSGIIHRKCVPAGYMTYYDKIPYISDKVYSGSTFRCIVSAIYNPFRFYVIFLENWNSLDDFQKHVQNLQWGSTKDALKTEFRESLVVGMFVLCFHSKQWYRGRIIQCLPKEQFRVGLLDFGTEVNVPIQNIQYLSQEFAGAIFAQAVLCELQLSAKFEKYRRTPWSPEQKTAFKKLLATGHAFVKLHQSSVDNFTNTTRWKVTLSMLDQSRCNILINNVAKDFEDVGWIPVEAPSKICN